MARDAYGRAYLEADSLDGAGVRWRDTDPSLSDIDDAAARLRTIRRRPIRHYPDGATIAWMRPGDFRTLTIRADQSIKDDPWHGSKAGER
jgi:hypothetical protein